MNNYLIADYILGYSLSNNDFFSAKDIAMELGMPAIGIAKIIAELCELNKDWFEIIPASSRSEMKIARKNEYDEEIIQWLINGKSKNYFKETEWADSSYYSTTQTPGKSGSSPLLSILRVIVFISIREIKKDREWVLKNIGLLKKAILKTRTR
ncbi:MAG: hypothetical protein ABIN89_13170 [Chitinophagaceae bacterium]